MIQHVRTNKYIMHEYMQVYTRYFNIKVQFSRVVKSISYGFGFVNHVSPWTNCWPCSRKYNMYSIPYKLRVHVLKMSTEHYIYLYSTAIRPFTKPVGKGTAKRWRCSRLPVATWTARITAGRPRYICAAKTDTIRAAVNFYSPDAIRTSKIM